MRKQTGNWYLLYVYFVAGHYTGCFMYVLNPYCISVRKALQLLDKAKQTLQLRKISCITQGYIANKGSI